MHSKITRHEMQNVSIYLYIYLRTCIFTVYIYLSIHILIDLSMGVSVFLFVSVVCPTGDLCVYHKNEIIVPMRTLKFGSFTDIKSVVLF